jgi:predicted dehydrogenase
MLGVVDSPGAAGYRPSWRHDPAASGGGVLMDMLHGIYLAEHLLDGPVESVSAFADSATDGDGVEGLALCRLESGRRAALVNIGWGMGQGGVIVHGAKGRAVVRYRNDGTMPWAPFEQLTVTTDAGARVVDLRPGAELGPLILDAVRDTLVDVAEAITEGRAPAADGAAALRTLEITVAAYASAALGRNVGVPLHTDDPLHTGGVLGLRDLDVAPSALVRRRGLFGLTPAGA